MKARPPKQIWPLYSLKELKHPTAAQKEKPTNSTLFFKVECAIGIVSVLRVVACHNTLKAAQFHCGFKSL